MSYAAPVAISTTVESTSTADSGCRRGGTAAIIGLKGTGKPSPLEMTNTTECRCPKRCEGSALPVDDHFMIRERYSRRLDGSKNRRFRCNLLKTACKHTNASGMRNAMAFELQNLLECASTPTSKEMILGMKSNPFRCSECPTEVTIEIQPMAIGQGRTTKKKPPRIFPFLVSVNRYVDVGDCKLPESPEWKALIHDYGFYSHRLSHHLMSLLRRFGMLNRVTAMDAIHREPICARFERQLQSTPIFPVEQPPRFA
ncbi:hypothetical protein K504DRAFT_505841 [Pleomassaria siparia CBS 279.74]|uniref:Uncharacterized protein n=1 Tax=Pleomassaria siparia CBS 279.74 TaxID=1314801 RepID=A0A6G1JYW7_9PLEO|nr:hypothetical protein K504DRAFT_505841 [Pleomassaria siparia CBS 279.74]